MPTADMETIFSLKKALRRSTAALLKSLGPHEIQRQSQAVRSQIQSRQLLQNARSVSCYLSMDSGELSTSRLAQDILAAGIPLYVPVIPPPPPKTTQPASTSRYDPPAPQYDMRMLRMYTVQDLQACPRDKWDIPDAGTVRLDQPDGAESCPRMDAEDSEAEPMDIIFVPGVLFDRSRGRLGHGKGFYDRYIERYREAARKRNERPPLLVALALEQQLSNDPVPRTDQDELIDMVITPNEIIQR